MKWISKISPSQPVVTTWPVSSVRVCSHLIFSHKSFMTINIRSWSGVSSMAQVSEFQGSQLDLQTWFALAVSKAISIATSVTDFSLWHRHWQSGGHAEFSFQSFALTLHNNAIKSKVDGHSSKYTVMNQTGRSMKVELIQFNWTAETPWHSNDRLLWLIARPSPRIRVLGPRTLGLQWLTGWFFFLLFFFLFLHWLHPLESFTLFWNVKHFIK